MKKIMLSILLFLPAYLFSQSFMLSNIPLPKTYVLDLDPYECDEACMQEYLDKGIIFSFIANAYNKLDNVDQNEAKVMFVSIFNLGSYHSSSQLKVALLLPYKKIGKYAASTTNTTLAYLMIKSHPYMLQSYKVESESVEDLEIALDKIREDGFEYVIAPLTKTGAANVVEINPALNIYFPTVSKKDLNTSSPYLFFGAIDYEAQNRLLLKEAASPLVIFSDKSQTGKKLALSQKQEFLHPTEDPILAQEGATGESSSFFDETMSLFSSNDEKSPEKIALAQKVEEEINAKIASREVMTYYISRRTTNVAYYLEDKEDIIDETYLINTPVVKTGMILSQVTLYDANATNILSTQINYNPLILSMTQYTDRKDMIIANSITEHDNVLIETNKLLNNDIEFDWINYSTTLGIDYFYSLITDEDRIYTNKMLNNQIIYNVELMQPARSKFKKYVRPQKEED